MKAKFDVTGVSCPMCNNLIREDEVVAREYDAEFHVRYYVCSKCDFRGRVVFDFTHQEGLSDDNWRYIVVEEKPKEVKYEN